jgi:ribosomal protein S12 methylthiotransferase accessory factor YcaO
MKIIDLSDGRYYMIRCSDWSVIIQSEDETEACTQALREMLEKHGKHLKLSSVMISHELKADTLEDEFDDLISYHSVSRMLANAGLHDLSSNVKMVFGA